MSTQPPSKKKATTTGPSGQQPDDPAPSYETALQQGAGGGIIAAGPSSSSSASPPSAGTGYIYGTNPYTQTGTAHILILPTSSSSSSSSSRHPPRTALYANPPTPFAALPEEQERRGPRAGPRFCKALMWAFVIYLLAGIVTGAITDAAVREGHRRHRDHRGPHGREPWDRVPDDGEGGWLRSRALERMGW